MTLFIAIALFCTIAVAAGSLVLWCCVRSFRCAAFLDDARLGTVVAAVVTLQQISVIGGVAGAQLSDSGAGAFFRYLSLLNLNIQIVKPGCSVPFISFVNLFWFGSSMTLRCCNGLFAGTLWRLSCALPPCSWLLLLCVRSSRKKMSSTHWASDDRSCSNDVRFTASLFWAHCCICS